MQPLVRGSGRRAKFDLTLSHAEDAGGAAWAALEYGRDLFDAATIERLVGHLERAAGRGGRRPGAGVSRCRC